MTPKEVYIPVPVEERLPEKGEQVFLISSREMNLPKRLATYFGGADEKEFKRMADHWLEKKEGYFLTKEELEKVFKDAWYLGAKSAFERESSEERYANTDFNDWINTH